MRATPAGRTRQGPDFIGIGPPKTGTTWLFANLSAHPGIWMPPNKELHWFDRVQDGGPFTWRDLLRAGSPETRRWRAYTAVQIRGHLLGRLHQQPLWKLRYIVGLKSDASYIRLFDVAKDRLAGEITPSYCDLGDEMVDRVRAVAPDARIVMTIRNPIERSWSEVRRHLGRRHRRPIPDIPHDEIVSFLQSPECLTRSDYVPIVERWRDRFRHLHVLFLDDASMDPSSALSDTLAFLGVDPSWEPVKLDALHVGWGTSEVPPPYRAMLAESLLEPIRRAADELGGPALGWLDYAQASR